MADGPDLVDRRLADGVCWLALGRPEKRNALSAALVAALTKSLARAAIDSETRVVALTGEGPDFSSGADLSELGESTRWTREERLADANRLGALFSAVREHPKPVVAVVRGRALGGGSGLALACDALLVHEDAVLGFPEVRIGFVPALVMAILRRKLPETRIFDLVAGGEPVGARSAQRMGLATRVFPRESFDEDAARYLTRLASRPPGAMAAAKRLIIDTDGLSFGEAMTLGAEVNAEARGSEELRQGLRRLEVGRCGSGDREGASRVRESR